MDFSFASGPFILCLTFIWAAYVIALKAVAIRRKNYLEYLSRHRHGKDWWYKVGTGPKPTLRGDSMSTKEAEAEAALRRAGSPVSTLLPAGGRKGLEHGLYRLYWADGSNSLAAVGSGVNGFNWYAPVNWVRCPGVDWSVIKRADRLCEPFRARIVINPTEPGHDKPTDTKASREIDVKD